MKIGDLIIGFLVFLVMVDAFYKGSHPDCRPNAPWFLKAMEYECFAIKEKAAEEAIQRQQEAMLRRAAN
jgi:hypothetical protein